MPSRISAASLLDLATSVVPYLALSVLMYLALGVSDLLALAIAIPAAGFLVRTFILFHDCSHGSFLVIQACQQCGLARCWDCWSTPRFCAGATTTRSTTPHPATWIGAAAETSAR